MRVTHALESQLTLEWNQEGLVDNITIYWKTEHGNEHKITIPGDETSFLLDDNSLTAATMYGISMESVVGYNTSSRSMTLFAGTGICLMCMAEVNHGYIVLNKISMYL